MAPVYYDVVQCQKSTRNTDSYYPINKSPKLDIIQIKHKQIQKFVRFVLISDHLAIRAHKSK